jgi:transposase
MWKKADALLITQEQQKIMDAWIRGKKTPQRIALRSRICLLAAEGISHNAIAKKLNTSRSTVILWIKRFQEQGLTGISEVREVLMRKRLSQSSKPPCIPNPKTRLTGRHARWQKYRGLVILRYRGYGMLMACNLTV